MAGWRGGESRGLGGPDRGCPVSHGRPYAAFLHFYLVPSRTS